MAYTARRNNTDNDDKRANRDNSGFVRKGLEMAASSNIPVSKVAQAAKITDDLTGHKISDKAGKIITKKIPEANRLSNALAKGGSPLNFVKPINSSSSNDKVNEVKANGGDQANGSRPSLGGTDASSGSGRSDTEAKQKRSFLGDDNNDNNANSEKQTDVSIGGILSLPIIKLLIPIVLIFFVILLPLIITASVSSFVGSFDDAFGFTKASGEDIMGFDYSAGTLEQQEFQERVNSIRLKYQTQGKYTDGLMVVAVFNVLERNGANVSYDNISDAKIEEIMNAMFVGNVYNKEAFKNNLVSLIIPKYLPNLSQKAREDIVEEIFEHVDNSYELLGKEPEDYSCVGGSCTYDIKGFYISDRGNVSRNIQISNLYVRLMQCGTADGHNYGGVFGQPLAGEELVPFEKYILGVAYQEIGDDAPAEAIKAQMVAARSYILARHVDMGGWRTLQEENGKWVLQAASCTQDQVYCDPDQGCSANDGQWGQVHSGLNYNNGFSRGAMPADSPLRLYANTTQGELLVNSQGYIVYSGYRQSEQNKFSALANQGLNYKQILMQVYNQGSRNYGATDIQKAVCGGNCISFGDYVNWKQYSEPWASVNIGNTSETIKSVGCLATSIAILIKKSGVPTGIENFNPGTFVEKLNQNGGFDQASLQWNVVTNIIPSFQYQGKIEFNNLSKSEILSKIKSVIETPGVYAVVKVNGEQVNLGTHWVAIDAVNGNDVVMIDPGSNNRSLFSTYSEVLEISYYKVSG